MAITKVACQATDVVTVCGAGMAYRWVDRGVDRAAQFLHDDTGHRAIPVVVTPGDTIPVEPSSGELAAVIGVVAG